MSAQALDRRALRAWPLPPIAHDADKEQRGRAVVVGGSREIAGAAQLAAVAALRAGAGKLVIATGASVAAPLGAAVPEARVIALEEQAGGAFRRESLQALQHTLHDAAAVLVGPGMMDARASADFVAGLLAACRDVPVVVDAAAMDVVGHQGPFTGRVLMTPHAGEMAHLLRVPKEQIESDPQRIALRCARDWNAVVALKGATTWLACPDGRSWVHEGGDPGLATSGSGDVLAGLVAGFAARRVPLEQAAAWGIVVHALAARALSRKLGPLGFVARELAGAVPALLKKLGAAR